MVPKRSMSVMERIVSSQRRPGGVLTPRPQNVTLFGLEPLQMQPSEDEITRVGPDPTRLVSL